MDILYIYIFIHINNLETKYKTKNFCIFLENSVQDSYCCDWPSFKQVEPEKWSANTLL